MDGPAESPIVGWKPSAASAIFDSPNILRILCANLATRKDILNMAVLCKAASSIALDEIWRSRRSMAQLLAPLSCDGFISAPNLSTPKRNLSLCRVLTTQDSAWIRLCQYASRIKVLTVNEEFLGGIQHGTILRLMQLTGDHPIFPHLRDLTLSGKEGGTVVSDLSLFVSPNVRRVSIQINSDHNDANLSAHSVEVFLFIMQEKGVMLKHLSLTIKIPVSISSFFSTLSRSNTLCVLHLDGVRYLDADETIWVTNLGLLDGLEELKLVVEEDKSNRMPLEAFRPPNAAGQENLTTQPEASRAPGPPEPKVVPRYPSLKKLYLQAPARVIEALLSCMMSTVLVDLTLKPQATKAVNTVPELCACFNLLGLQTNLHGSLKRFMFEANLRASTVQYGYYYQEPHIPSSHLLPLRKMSHLEHLEIANCLDTTDDFVLAVVAQLPCLPECIIPLSSAPASITVFHTLAASCPKLTRLQLPIDTDGNLPPFDPRLYTSKKHQLQHLKVSEWQRSPGQDQLFLAVRHLNASFPFLRLLEGGYYWGTVLTMLGTLQDISRSSG